MLFSFLSKNSIANNSASVFHHQIIAFLTLSGYIIDSVTSQLKSSNFVPFSPYFYVKLKTTSPSLLQIPTIGYSYDGLAGQIIL